MPFCLYFLLEGYDDLLLVEVHVFHEVHLGTDVAK